MGRYEILSVIVIIMYIASMPRAVERNNMTVTVTEVGYVSDDAGYTHESAVLKDINGTEMTFRAATNRYIDSIQGYKNSLSTYFKGESHSLNAGEEITIAFVKYDDGKTRVKYNNRELVRVE